MDNARGFLDSFWDLGSWQRETRINAAVKLLSYLVKCQICSSSAEGSDSSSPEAHPPFFTTPDDHGAGSINGAREKKASQKDRRSNAATGLVSLKGTGASADLEYAVNRLVAGLASSRTSARQGYAVALLLILFRFKKEVPRERILTAIYRSTSIAKVAPADVKDLLIGRLLGLTVLQRTGYFRTNACLTQLESVFASLWEIFDKKVYLQEAAALLIRLIVVDVASFSPALALQFVSPRLAALESFRVSTPSSHLAPRHAKEEISPGGTSEDHNDKTDKAVRSTFQAVSKTLGKTVTGCLPCGLAALLLHLRWEASRREDWLSTGNNSKGSQGPIVNVNGILTNFDLMHRKHQDLLLSYLADTAAFHPRLHSLWDGCLKLLLHSNINANPKAAFILWWEGVDRTLFPKPRLPAAAAGKYETEKQRVEVQETTSLQKEFLGLRLALEVAIRLKRSAVVGQGLNAVHGAAQEKGDEENTRVGPDAEPRVLRQEEALELMADIWTRGRGFVRCLARHVEASKSDPLHDMANFVLDSLGYLFAGSSSGALPISSLSGSPAKRRDRPNRALVAPAASHAELSSQTVEQPTQPCGCPADPTPEGLFTGLSCDSIFDYDEEIFSWTQRDTDSQSPQPGDKKQWQPPMLKHPFGTEVFGPRGEVLWQPLALPLSSRLAILRVWGEMTGYNPMRKSSVRKVARLLFGGGLPAEDMRPEALLLEVLELAYRPGAAATGPSLASSSARETSASPRCLQWVLDFLLLLPQQLPSSCFATLSSSSVLSSLFVSVLLSSSFQFVSTSPPATPPVLFVSPPMLLAALSSFSPDLAIRSSGEKCATLPSLVFLLSPAELPWRVILSKLSVLACFLLSKHVEQIVKQAFLHGSGRERTPQLEAPVSWAESRPEPRDSGASLGFSASTASVAEVKFIEELHGVHTVCFSLFSASSASRREEVRTTNEAMLGEDEASAESEETLQIRATCNAALVKKGKWKKAMSEVKGGFVLNVHCQTCLTDFLELPREMDEAQSDDSSGSAGKECSASEKRGAAGAGSGQKGEEEARTQTDDTVRMKREELLRACFEASSQSLELTRKLLDHGEESKTPAADASIGEGQKKRKGQNKREARQEEVGSEERTTRAVVQVGINTALRVVALGVSMLCLYPYLVSRCAGYEKKISLNAPQEIEGNEQGRIFSYSEGDDSSEAEEGGMEGGSLFGSESNEREENLVKEEERELIDFYVLLGEFSHQMQQLLTWLETSAGKGGWRKGDYDEEFIDLAAEVLSKTAGTVSRLLFIGSSGFGGGFLRSIGKALWKELCGFVATEDLDAVVDVFLECGASQDEAKRESEEGHGGHEEMEEEEEKVPSKDLKTGSHTAEADHPETDESEATCETSEAEDSQADDNNKAAKEKRRGGKGKGRDCSERTTCCETFADEQESCNALSSDVCSAEKKNKRENTQDDDSEKSDGEDYDDDRFSIELGADDTYRALLDEDGSALPGVYAPPHAALRAQASNERKQRLRDQARHLQLRLRTLDVLQVYLESSPWSSRALSILSVLYRSFGRASLKSSLEQARKKQNAALFQHVTDKTKRVLLNACAYASKRRPVYTSGLPTTKAVRRQRDFGSETSCEDKAGVLLTGRSVVAAAWATLAWEKEQRKVGSKGDTGRYGNNRLPLSLPFPPVIISLEDSTSAPLRGFESLTSCVEGGSGDVLEFEQALSGSLKSQKDVRKSALLYACWVETQQLLAQRALEILDVCTASRNLSQPQSASAAHSLGLTLLTHVFKTEQQVASFFGRELCAAGAFPTYQIAWAGSVASQVLNVALNEWATTHSSRQQHLDAAFFRFYADRRPDFLKHLDFLGTAELRAKSVFVRRECVSIAAAVVSHPSFFGATVEESTKEGKEGKAKHKTDKTKGDSERPHAGARAPVVGICWKAWIHRTKRGGGRREKNPNLGAEDGPVCSLLEPLPVRQEVASTTLPHLLRQMASLAERVSSPGTGASFSSASQMKASHKEMLVAMKTILQTTWTRMRVEKTQGGSVSMVHRAAERSEEQHNGMDTSEKSTFKLAVQAVAERVKDAALKLRGSAGRHAGIYNGITRLVGLLLGGEGHAAPTGGGRDKQKKRRRGKRELAFTRSECNEGGHPGVEAEAPEGSVCLDAGIIPKRAKVGKK
ncbi:dna polymerase phi subunit [Cystoisospora suis]|uniref:Dna polymerase phi subunit n=1 Tax=Cystoisospora suis TaxID=483139 RepID=A0A2C6KGS0_9APIC|nr:dna polymerase phi subunit [Cystoisospora suis]